MVLVTSVLLAACSTPSDSPGAESSPTGVSPSPQTTSSGGPAAPAGTDAPPAETPPPLALEAVASGLADPISVTATPDGWLLVNERGGRIVAIDPTSGETSIALDISDRVLGQGEQGLLGLALHPEWPAVGRAFVHYSSREGGATVLSEFAAVADGATPVLEAASEQVLLTHEQPFPNHNGGQLAFGPDGYLYLGLGDGGAGGDPLGNGQNPHTLLGAILRLDVSSPAEYTIPPDNPFADGEAGAPEVFLYGLRNPWRFSFDRATDLLWVADVGQNAYEEIDRVDPTRDAGANLGWAITEGAHCFATEACDTDGLLMPVSEYGRDQGCSVSGGHVYRGTAIPDLAGWYIFGDYCSGLLFGLRSDVTQLTPPTVLVETDANISAFGEDVDGELYVADIGSGTLYRIVAED